MKCNNESVRKTLALTLTLSPWRERSELLSRLAPLNPPASGARDVPARSGFECNRRLGEGSGTSRLSEPLRPGTGRAPKEGSWAGCSRDVPSPQAVCQGAWDGPREEVEESIAKRADYGSLWAEF